MRNWANLNNPYAYRNDNLLALGFKSYRSYLRSSLWADIKARVIARDRMCRRCRRTPDSLQVHHRAYDPATLAGTDINSLMAVCAGCHKKAEQPDNMRRSSYDRLTEASANLMKATRGRWRRRD